jgi:hypothetical protein
MIETEPKKEVLRIIAAGEKAGVRLRVLGGLAVCITSASAASHPRLKRAYADIDLVGLGKDERRITSLFMELGYEPNQRFNALHGRTRMIFNDPRNMNHVDIFLDKFQMCHSLDLRGRLMDGYLSLTIADLLLSKLQIIEMNEKDLKDILSILLDHEISETETKDRLDGCYVSNLTAHDWGFYTTASDNLARVKEKIDEYLQDNEAERVRSRVERLLHAMNSAEKSLKWKLRAKMGRRLEWYELPDEVDR